MRLLPLLAFGSSLAVAAAKDAARFVGGLAADAASLARLEIRRSRCPHVGGHGQCLPLCRDLFS